MQKTILKYGLLSGAAAAVLMVCTSLYLRSATDLKGSELFGYVGILLSMLFVFFGVRAYRDEVSGGSVGFFKAFLVGLLISLISCVCYVVTWMVVYETLMPDFMDKYIALSLEQMRSSGLAEAQIQQEAAKMETYRVMYQNPLNRAKLTFLEPFPVALLVTLLSALVLRRSRHSGGHDQVLDVMEK